jgi:hypothetical protein
MDFVDYQTLKQCGFHRKEILGFTPYPMNVQTPDGTNLRLRHYPNSWLVLADVETVARRLREVDEA